MQRNQMIDRDAAPRAGKTLNPYLHKLALCIRQATDRNDERALVNMSYSAEGAYQATRDERFNDLALEAEKAAMVVRRSRGQ